MEFNLPRLPYEKTALEPHISGQTLDFHYEKHHRTYLDKLRQLIEDEKKASMPLEEVIRQSTGAIFNNAAQVWNHTFYWHSMKPNGGGVASDRLVELMRRDFGSFEDLKQEFAEAASTHFGSGWTWLVLDADHRLRIMTTHDAENPLRQKHTPLLTLDVWEHAYYLDYQNARPEYVKTFLDHLVNWDFADENLEKQLELEQAGTA